MFLPDVPSATCLGTVVSYSGAMAACERSSRCDLKIFGKQHQFQWMIMDDDHVFVCLNFILYIYTYTYIYEPGPRTPTPPPKWYPPHPPQNLVFACYLHIYIHIYTYILPFPPLQPRISTLFAALESHDLVNGPCLPVYFYHNLFFEPPIACLAHGLQHICYLWITQSLPMQT